MTGGISVAWGPEDGVNQSGQIPSWEPERRGLELPLLLQQVSHSEQMLGMLESQFRQLHYVPVRQTENEGRA